MKAGRKTWRKKKEEKMKTGIQKEETKAEEEERIKNKNMN